MIEPDENGWCPHEIPYEFCGNCHEADAEEERQEHNVFRDGKVHILAEMCGTCIFRPRERFVTGAAVAELLRETLENRDKGGNVPCHSTLGTDENAICRGFWDRFAMTDAIMRLAIAMEAVVEDPVPPKR